MHQPDNLKPLVGRTSADLYQSIADVDKIASEMRLVGAAESKSQKHQKHGETLTNFADRLFAATAAPKP